MENLHTEIEYFLKEVMDISSSGMEHFYLFWKGRFLREQKYSVNYVKDRAKPLRLMPVFSEENGEVKIIFLEEREIKESKKWINILLLGITIVTTLMAGAVQQGINPLLSIGNLLKGLSFSMSIMLILGGHELGHYFAAKKNNVKTTLPYFIPGPTIIGTFGAVIKMKSPITDRNALIEIGAAGPIVGFILSTIALLIGFSLSTVVETQQGGLILGDSLIIKFLSSIYFPSLPAGKDVLLNPIAFAGWIGYFITAINLLPIGQLDGGHIAYALFVKKHRLIAYVTFAAILGAGLFWLGWLFWGFFILLILGFRHPPPLDNISKISIRNRLLGYISFVIFIITFVPNPFQLV